MYCSNHSCFLFRLCVIHIEQVYVSDDILVVGVTNSRANSRPDQRQTTGSTEPYDWNFGGEG
jgi:hypothetical protein